MSDKEKLSIREFWWGRHLPDRFKHIPISNPTESEWKILDLLKQMSEKAQNNNINIDFGSRFTSNEFHQGLPVVF